MPAIRRDLLLLVLLTLFWGVNWPVMKLGVAQLPPLFFRSICLAGGLVVIWAWARATGFRCSAAGYGRRS
jgi:drug/metabolite transporter (DMT)-like permease